MKKFKENFSFSMSVLVLYIIKSIVIPVGLIDVIILAILGLVYVASKFFKDRDSNRLLEYSRFEHDINCSHIEYGMEKEKRKLEQSVLIHNDAVTQINSDISRLSEQLNSIQVGMQGFGAKRR